MSIATELENLNDDILDAYDAISAKGGTIPAHKNTNNLDTAISSIVEASPLYIPRAMSTDVPGTYTYKKDGITKYTVPTGVARYGTHSMEYAYSHCESLVEVDLSALANVGGLIPGVLAVDANGPDAFFHAFEYCTNLTTVDLSNTVYLDGFIYAFYGCTSLTTVKFDKVKTVCIGALNNTFKGCTSLRSLSFPALSTSTYGGTQDMSFTDMLSGVTGCTVHFPASLQSTMSSWTSVRNGFGGTNTTVLFDLQLINLINDLV